MAYRHGVYISEVPTSIVPPVDTETGLPVVFGTAPINLASDPASVNTPTLCYTYAEAVAAFGYSDDWKNYTLCEFLKSHFALFAVSPVVLVNVLDPATHKTNVASQTVAMTNGVGTIADAGAMKNTLVAKLTAEGVPLDMGTDYTAAFNDDGKLVISRMATSTKLLANTASVLVSFDKLNPAAVTKDEIIGGVDVNTGAYEGLELLNKVFPLTRLVPGMVLAPGWSTDPEVAAVMVAKAGNINEHFRCLALTDVPTDTVKKHTDVAAWKENNNFTSPRQVVCWPKVKLGDDVYHLSTQLAGVICQTDAANDDIPYNSPSNKALQANGAVLADGTVVSLGPDQAAYLNGQGVVTAFNFIGGWKAWGNRTGCYPSNTDPKDAFIPVRRMFDWIGNTLVQTFWSKVDYPVNRRLIETIVDSCNIWLNGLTARQFILGGRVEFLDTENPTTDLMDGIVKFHLYVTPPGPAREIDFILEYDTAYLKTLFG